MHDDQCGADVARVAVKDELGESEQTSHQSNDRHIETTDEQGGDHEIVQVLTPQFRFHESLRPETPVLAPGRKSGPLKAGAPVR